MTVSQLVYKPRLKYKELAQRTKTVKPGDLEGRVLAYLSVLTGQVPAVLENLDTVDMGIAQADIRFLLLDDNSLSVVVKT